MKPSLCILHWMPVEYFPPVMNMARYFADREQWAVSLCTNANTMGRSEFSYPSVAILRGTYPTRQRGIRRLFVYASFHVKTLLYLLKSRPDVILYIEPHSALPAVLAKLLRRKTRIFVHYHEYHSPEEFDKPGMRMANWFHSLESKWLYPNACWLSQTNATRRELFLKDNPEVDRNKAFVLGNYPPAAWWKGQNRAWAQSELSDTPMRVIYVGALSRSDTYIQEAVQWIKSLGRAATLDIYSYNLHPETRFWLRTIADEQIRFHEEGVDYDALPEVLRDFHVGLVLYRGSTANYVHNATNKLFEYLACGLDVLYPKEMVGVTAYADCGSKPRVVECDFSASPELPYRLAGRHALPSRGAVYSAEAELARLEEVMNVS